MIRPATHDDVSRIVDLGDLMVKESRFSVLEYAALKVDAFIRSLIDGNQFVLVSEDSGIVNGYFIGMVSEHWASRDLISYDLAMFIHPDHRGGISAAKMVKRYLAWAKSKGAKMINIGVSTGVNPEQTGRLYEKIGFNLIGYIYEGN